GQGRAPSGGIRVASVDSPPMGTIVGEMLRESDNLTAELLTKELGKRYGGGGTTAAGLVVVRDDLAKAGLPASDLAAADGSGRHRPGAAPREPTVTVTPLPMFPLGTVLFPFVVLPLHVFEPRYRALTRDCLAGSGEFGVVLIERGLEVGGGDERFPVGTVA